MAETGVAGLENFEAITFTGLFAPAKIPADVLAKLNAAVAELVKDPEVVTRFGELTATPVSSTPQEYAAMLDQEDRKMVPLIKELGIKME
jgi:tripartite-type tricarboxylate transporter receptor subunit TctC